MNSLSNLFVPFAVRYMGQPLKVDYLYAVLCRMDAAYFISGRNGGSEIHRAPTTTLAVQ
ncbi:MAG: hypothetical protein WC298_04830 [Sideroxydans sp.]|jgi:hypothetical protein